MSLIALSIDSVLPAYNPIQQEMQITHQNDLHWLVTMLFAGLMIGQFFAGPLSDHYGRKKTIIAGLLFYILGASLAALAQNYETLLIARFMQGLGGAGPRVVIQAMVRDRFSGAAMARIMSFILTVFIFIPTIAPLMGQGIIWLANWRWLFYTMAIIAAVSGLLLWFRQPETLKEPQAFSWAQMGYALHQVFTTRVTLLASLGSAFAFGGLMSFVTLSPLILQGIYAVGDWFPFWFGLNASAIGFATLTNAWLVKRYAMRHICMISHALAVILSLVALGTLLSNNAVMPFGLFMVYNILLYGLLGLTFGNYNAMAMEPMGHIAGAAAAVIASISTMGTMLLGGLVAELFNGTLVPIITSYFLYGFVAFFLAYFCKSRK